MAFRAPAFEQPVGAGDLKVGLVMIEGEPFLKGFLAVAFPARLRGELFIELLFMDAGMARFAEARFGVVECKVAGQLAL